MKTNDEPKAMREIHDIRRSIQEETKDMSPAELLEYIKKNSDDFEKRGGLKLRRLSITPK